MRAKSKALLLLLGVLVVMWVVFTVSRTALLDTPDPVDPVGEQAVGHGSDVRPDHGPLLPEDPAGESEVRSPLEVDPLVSEPGIVSGATHVFRGRVVDSTKHPIPGARVYAGEWNRRSFGRLDSLGSIKESETLARQETLTDESGLFEFVAFESGWISVAVRAAGFAPGDFEQFFVPDHIDSDLGDLTLHPGLTLSGRVLDPNGEPVAGARIDRHDPAERVDVLGLNRRRPVAESSADGRFRVDALEPGPWELLVEADSYPTLYARGQTDGPGHEENLELCLKEAFEISGRVNFGPGVDPTKYQVRARAKDQLVAHWRNQSAACDSDGLFCLHPLHGPPEVEFYEVRVRPAREYRGHLDELCDPLELPPGATDIVIDIPDQTWLAFDLIDATLGTPLADASLSVSTHLHEQTSSRHVKLAEASGLSAEAPGHYVVGALPPIHSEQRFEIEISVPEYEVVLLRELNPPPGEVLNLGTIACARLPVVDVLIVDDESGRPVSGATVLLESHPENDGYEGEGAEVSQFRYARRREEGRSPEVGRLRLPAVRGPLACLTVTHPDFAPYTPGVLDLDREAVDGVVSVRVRLTQGGRCRIEVVDANGKPQANARVSQEIDCQDESDDRGSFLWLYAIPSETYRMSGANGEVEFGHICPGLYSYRGYDTASSLQGGDSIQVLIEAGELMELSLTVPTTGSLSGRLTLDGRPLEGARLVIQPGGNAASHPGYWAPDNHKVETSPVGTYHFGPQAVGPHFLSIEHSSLATTASALFDVRAEGTRFDLDLVSGFVSGRIEDERGRGVAGARVGVCRVEEIDILLRRLRWKRPNSAISETDGAYQLVGVPAEERLVLVAACNGYQHAVSSEFELATGEPAQQLNLGLAPSGTLIVELIIGDDRDPGEAGVGRVTVREVLPENEDLPARHFTSRSKSLWTLADIAPGRWLVELEPYEGFVLDAPPQEVEVVAGHTSRVVFYLP